MTIYFLVGITVVLSGVAALQLFYTGYLERISKRQASRINELEKYCIRLSKRVNATEDTLLHQADLINSIEYMDDEMIVGEEDIWADVIEDA